MGRISRTNKKAEVEALIEFWFRIQHFLRVRARISRAAGLQSREYELLLAVKTISANRGASISLMAERLCLQQHIAAALVKSLVTKGLLLAERSPRDRRSLALKLTPQGAKRLRSIVRQSVIGLRAEGPGLSAALKKTLSNDYGRTALSSVSARAGKAFRQWS